MLNDPYRNPPPGHVPPARGRPRMRRADWERRAPLLAICAGLLSLMVILAVWYNRGTNQAARDLKSANALVVEKHRQVEEARQLLEQRIAELRAAQAQVAAGAERLDVEMVRERRTETEAGEVVPLDSMAAPRAALPQPALPQRTP